MIQMLVPLVELSPLILFCCCCVCPIIALLACSTIITIIAPILQYNDIIQVLIALSHIIRKHTQQAFDLI